MKTTVTSFLLATLLATTLALPTEDINERGVAVEKRGPKKGKDKSNPKKVEWDNSNWYSTSEEDCYTFLCTPQYAGEHVFQRQPNERASKDAYTKGSRANKMPFKRGGQYGGKPINDQTQSAEDAPPRSLQVGDRMRYVLPTELSENNRQGNAIKQGYRKAEDGGLDANEWGEIHMKGNLGPCCRAWEAGDFTACTDGRCGGKPRDDLFDEDGVNMEDILQHKTRSGNSWGFTSGFSKRKRDQKRGEELVKTLIEIKRKRDEEDARSALERRAAGEFEDSYVPIKKRNDDDDFMAAGYEVDTEDLE